MIEDNKSESDMKSTVITSEVEKFGKMSEDWWNPNGGLRALHSMNSIRVPFIQSTVHITPGIKRILDLGCGGGFLSEGLGSAFQSLGWSDEDVQIIGMEPSQDAVTVARGHLPEQLKRKVSYICDTIENYVQNNPTAPQFDTVVMSEVIEHVDNPEEFLKYAISVVKPGGSIILTTPAKTFLSWIGVILFAEYVMKIVPVGTHEYKKFVGQAETLQMFKENGCEVKDVRGLYYNPISNTWKWNNYCKGICYAVHAVKPIKEMET